MFTNIAPDPISRKKARQTRAVERLQTCSTKVTDEGLPQHLENKLVEYTAHCRKRNIYLDNAYGVALNILAPYAKQLGTQRHQDWLARFVSESKKVCSISKD